ncbi:hypothetical protein G6F55_004189 [Rhizopus delemar]|uniref:Uncharacterized protein n=1 Tax=Rhizopus delemar TaxID=936053 RepID=A0A9P6ZBH6_9FUNG|nr:hypothetical protein G6F55_004189 [Rhizopus delemar]KAG1574425.1 hypothetical protein G6F50_001980 [Rhizopus delemar]
MMALNIYISFDNKQPSHFQLIPEKFNWDNLVTILDLSTTQVSNRDSLVFHYLHPLTHKQETISNQTQLDTLMTDIKEIPYDGLFFYAGDNSKPNQSLVVCNPFEKLSQLVKQHQPLGYRESRWVGILASQMASSSQENFETELSMLGNLISRGGRKMHKRARHINHGPEATNEAEKTEDSTSSSSSESEGDECLKERGRHHIGRHGRGKHFGPFGKYDKHRKHGRRHSEHFEPFGGHGGPFGGHGGPFGGHGGQYPFLSKKESKLMKKLYHARY